MIVAYAIDVFHRFRTGATKLAEYADSRAGFQRATLIKGELVPLATLIKGEQVPLARRIAGALCIAAMIAILAFAFARKIPII